MFRSLRAVLALACLLLLAACGGGGGGGDAPAAGNSISLDRTAVSLLLGTSNRDVAQAVVTVTFRGAGVVVGTLPGQTAPSWLATTSCTPSGGTVQVTLAAIAAGQTPGAYTTTLRFATGNADLTGVVTRDLQVTLNVAPRVTPAALDVDTAVGAAPARQALSRTEGQAPDTLAVTADPTGLADGLHLARVTLSPRNEPDVANSVVVRVALAVNRGLVVTPATIFPMTSCGQLPVSAADPLRNRFYVACGSTVDAHDADSSAKIGSLSVPGAQLVNLITTADGSALFGVDSAQARIQRIDLDAFAVGAAITPARIGFGTQLAATEVQGVPVLATSELEFFNAQTGARLADAASLYSSNCCGLKLAARRDGRALYAINTTPANHDLLRLSLAWRNAALVVKRTHLVREQGNGNGLALDEADTTLVTATGVVTVNGANAGALRRDADTLVEAGSYPMLDGVGAHGVVIGGQRAWLSHHSGVAAYDSTRVRQGRYSAGDSLSDARLSADQRRMFVVVSLAANGYMHFIDAP